ncbi:MAG: (deoxy)nucleoside triphosphate pyrophosphohydrolase [Leucobacter sp.]
MAKQINVVGAVIVRDETILCAQRGPGALEGMWEFPGGKIEPGETPEEALRRELVEELLIDVEVGKKVVTTVYEYDFGVVTLTTFYCRLDEGEPTLTEHVAVRWLAVEELPSLEWAPADVPAIDKIRSDFRAVHA